MNSQKTLITLTLLGLGFFLAGIAPALADGYPLPWQLGLQNPATPVAEQVNDFHQLLLIIIYGIAAFVLLLVLYVIIRFNKKANPEPRIFSHNTPLEILWTIIPVLILIVIAIPSMKVLYYMDRTTEPEMTLKVTAFQWYWGYEYPDHDDINFTSYMIPDADIDESLGQKRLLSVDNPIVLPIDTNVQILVTSADVIHAFAVPAFGIKKDAIPGRINETWVRITKPGTYYGQCSELCGKDHAYMPIEIKAVTKDEFEAWVESGGETLAAAADKRDIELASSQNTTE